MFRFPEEECSIWRLFLKMCRTSRIDDESELYNIWESIEENEELRFHLVDRVIVKKVLQSTGAAENEIEKLLQ